jgi:hypothetical protein
MMGLWVVRLLKLLLLFFCAGDDQRGEHLRSEQLVRDNIPQAHGAVFQGNGTSVCTYFILISYAQHSSLLF